MTLKRFSYDYKDKLFPNTVDARKRWHRGHLASSGARGFLTCIGIVIYFHGSLRSFRFFLIISHELLRALHGFSFIRIMSDSCFDECFTLSLSCTERKACQRFSLNGPKTGERLRDCCDGSSSREVPRKPEDPGVHPGLGYTRNRAVGSDRTERPQQRAVAHRDSPSGSSSSSSPSTTSPPSVFFRLKPSRSSSGRWNEVLRLELRLPVELERCFAANEALRSSEPDAGGNSEVCASGDMVSGP